MESIFENTTTLTRQNLTVGKRVKKGDVLMIIESMKLMNEVLCEQEGTVAEILVQNGDAVEFDQPILRIE